MFTDAELSGSEMAHQGAMGLALLVAAIVSVKFLGLATYPGSTRPPKTVQRGDRERKLKCDNSARITCV